MASVKSRPIAVARPAPTRLRAEERREQLIQVAVDLFSRKGFKGTTTREIALAAGVTEAMIFRHFATKEKLYTAIIDRKVNSPMTAVWLAEMRQAMDSGDDRGVFERLIKGIIHTHRTDPKFERLMLYASLEGNEIARIYMQQATAAIVDTFRQYFTRRQKQGRLRAVGSEAALMAIVGMAQHFALKKYTYGLEGEWLPDEEAIASFTKIAVHGLCVKAGTK